MKSANKLFRHKVTKELVTYNYSVIYDRSIPEGTTSAYTTKEGHEVYVTSEFFNNNFEPVSMISAGEVYTNSFGDLMIITSIDGDDVHYEYRSNVVLDITGPSYCVSKDSLQKQIDMGALTLTTIKTSITPSCDHDWKDSRKQGTTKWCTKCGVYE